MKERILKLIKELKERESNLLDLVNATSGEANEYWTGKWYEIMTTRNKLEEIIQIEEIEDE